MTDLSNREHRRKEQLLTQHQASNIGAGVGVVLKRAELFLVTTESGDVPFSSPHALGLFHRDARFLDGYELTLNGEPLIALSSGDAMGSRTTHYLTNPAPASSGPGSLERNTLQVLRERVIRGGTLFELISVRNFDPSSVSIVLRLAFRSRFEDLFVLKGFVSGPRGEWLPPEVPSAAEVRLGYRAIDGTLQTTALGFDPTPDRIAADAAEFELSLESKTMRRIAVTIQPCIGDPNRAFRRRSPERLQHWLSLPARRWPPGNTRVSSSHEIFNRVMLRGLDDLGLLRSRIGDLHYFAAGIPWFVTLFGRDSALVAMQALPFAPHAARETAQLLARFQASESDPYRDAQPGKILHELRRGELARSDEIPQSPTYYGTVDATLLFLMLIANCIDWSGDIELAREIRPNIDRALEWIDEYGDRDGDGYLDYDGRYAHGLLNQGWKDSGNAIVNADGSLPHPPIALVEVQGYLYRAWLDTARVLRMLDDPGRAADLEQRAEALRERFDRDFWSEDLGFYILGLQQGGSPIASVTSNGGHVLQSGIVPAHRVSRIATRLFEPDMFSGWGIRTLSHAHPAYNPMSYHLGSVWPHDNALIIAGLRRYGFRGEALKLFDAIFDAATHMRDFRLPELYCGYAREADHDRPVPYPVACQPQAWAASSLLHALVQLLGIQADAPRRSARIVRPCLPRWIEWMHLSDLRIGDAKLDLRFDQRGDALNVEWDVREGELDVERVS